MSRHNRRRTRANHRSLASLFPPPAFELPDLCPTEASDLRFSAHLQASRHSGDVTARHWQNRYAAWQVRERKQREERLKLRAEQTRIFGGEGDEGDEDGLCGKMMDFFGGLDFIEG